MMTVVNDSEDEKAESRREFPFKNSDCYEMLLVRSCRSIIHCIVSKNSKTGKRSVR